VFVSTGVMSYDVNIRGIASVAKVVLCRCMYEAQVETVEAGDASCVTTTVPRN
jgi:hypothetical protein